MPAPPLSPAASEMLQKLQQRMQQIEGARSCGDQPPVSTGCENFNALLPAGGLQRGTLWECFPAAQTRSGNGAGTLAMLLARSLAAEGGAVVVVDREQTFYPPAAVALGIPWRQLLVVRPKNTQDELWALDQALRCRGVAAVWAPLKKISPRDFRRLQLAAESGSAVGLLLRAVPWRRQPSWAHVQLALAPLRGTGLQTCTSPSDLPKNKQTWRFAPRGWHLRIEILRIRGAKLNAAAKSTSVQIDEQTGRLLPSSLPTAAFSHAAHPLHSSSPLADSATDRGTA